MTMIFNGTTGITFPDGQTQDVGVPDPGTNGNVLTSNGTIWTSAAPGTYSQWTTSGSNIFYNTGNVGIGTTSPVSNANETSLTINGTNIGRVDLRSGGTARFNLQAGSVETSFVNNGATPFVYYINSAERMRVDSNGNVGIGTSSPSYRASIVYTNSAGGVAETGLYLRNTSTANSTQILLDGNRSWSLMANGSFGNPAGGFTIIDNTAGTSRININSSGNVGIGTTSPQGRLDVLGSAKVGAGTYPVPSNNLHVQAGNYGDTTRATLNLVGGVGNNNTQAGYAIQSWNTTDVGNPQSTFAISTLNWTGTDFSVVTERMRITSGGDVAIGTTTSGGRLTVSTATGSYVTRFITEGNNQDYIAFVSGTNIVGSVVRVGGTNVAYNTSSDYRLKENIAPMTGALAKVAQLKPCNWTWKLDGSDGQGFIAHELQEVCPDAVNGTKDEVDEDGKPKYQGVDTSFLVATLTAAIQEQQAIITDLKQRIETLENR